MKISCVCCNHFLMVLSDVSNNFKEVLTSVTNEAKASLFYIEDDEGVFNIVYYGNNPLHAKYLYIMDQSWIGNKKSLILSDRYSTGFILEVKDNDRIYTIKDWVNKSCFISSVPKKRLLSSSRYYLCLNRETCNLMCRPKRKDKHCYKFKIAIQNDIPSDTKINGSTESPENTDIASDTQIKRITESPKNTDISKNTPINSSTERGSRKRPPHDDDEDLPDQKKPRTTSESSFRLPQICTIL